MPARHPARFVALLAVALLAALLPVGASSTASAQSRDTWLRPPNHPGAPATYNGTFADPSIIAVGGTYYGYATNTGGSHLPVLHSTALVNWTPALSYNRTTAATRSADSARFLNNRPVYVAQRPDTSFDPWINDALLDYHEGARLTVNNHNHMRVGYWAPGVAKIGAKYVAYHAAPQNSVDHRCIRVSTANKPEGPFIPQPGTGWLQCDSQSTGDAFSPNGSLDPDPFVDANGTPYLIWKSEGNPNPPYAPTILWSRQLNSAGTAFAPGSVKRELLRTAAGTWEGSLIENPSMVRHNGRYYLFYSGNRWVGSSYATGYAECSGPTGPCSRPRSAPLLATSSRFVGPGGADAFVDANGNLQLAFHHWVNGTQAAGSPDAYRALEVVTLSRGSSGLLQVSGSPADNLTHELSVRYTPVQRDVLNRAAARIPSVANAAQLQHDAPILFAFLAGLSGGQASPLPDPITPRGTTRLVSVFTGEELRLLDRLGDHFGGLNREQSVKLSAIVLAYLVLV